jgi:beta-glucosidase
VLAPAVNLHRTPYSGRHFECFSEDPLLTARIGVAYVRGLQRNGVGATVKHFVANDSETERKTLDAQVDERTLRELYLAPFEAII